MKAGTPDLATLGHRIRHFRGERGMTLDQLGDAVGLAGSQLSLIENGTTYSVRPFIEPSKTSVSSARISRGSRQLFVGPASSS